MRLYEEYEALVKGQSEYHADSARKISKQNPGSKNELFHKSRVFRWEALLNDLRAAQEKLDGKAACAPALAENTFTLKPKDLEGLPPELLEQLGLSTSDWQELRIVEVVDKAGGMLSLEKVMIEYYRTHREVLERDKLTAKIYRMIRKGLLYTVPGRKGVYSTTPQGDTAPPPEADPENGGI